MRRPWTRRCSAAAAAVILGGALPGCSSSVLSTPAPSFSALFNSAKVTTTSGTANPASQPDFECPDVGIRAGASTMAVSANPSEESAMNLRYQAGINQTARECKLNGQTLTIRVGVQGRVVVGPAGGPGQIDVPLRLAVVHEGPEPKTILTKLNRVPVTIPPGDGNVPFTMIEEELSFPMPRAGVIDEYIVYVGFDPQGLREPARRQRGGPPRPAR
jgi:hypothetical protein